MCFFETELLQDQAGQKPLSALGHEQSNRRHIWKKNDFPSLSNNQLLIALQGPSSLFPSHSGILTGLILCRSWAGHHSCGNFICLVDMLHPEDSLSLPSSTASGFLFFMPLPQYSLSLNGRDIKEPPKDKHSESLLCSALTSYESVSYKHLRTQPTRSKLVCRHGL